MSSRPAPNENPRDSSGSQPGDCSGYPPISDYAIVGDCRTAALVSRYGSVDWYCLPHFSGEAIFAALLDPERGGHFSISPQARHCDVQRSYEPGTNVLVTRFKTATGSARLCDCMPLNPEAGLRPERELLRVLEVDEGEVKLRIEYRPRPGYGSTRPRLKHRGRRGWLCEHKGQALMLHSDVALEPEGDGSGLAARLVLRAGEKRYFSLSYARHDILVQAPLGAAAEERIAVTLKWWRGWLAGCTYEGPYAEAVRRSLLTLKLLTFHLSGAIVAAPSLGLPEWPGGKRNFDYRYCWLRDAAMSFRAFAMAGFTAEAESFIGWLLHTTRLTWPKLQVMYDVYGGIELGERRLDHLAGYCRSSPVQAGNRAHGQRQLDIYGEVVLAVDTYLRNGGKLRTGEQRLLVGLGTTVCREWRRPDRGIWEVRGGGRHHTHSKVLCWATLDRLLRMHADGLLPRVPVRRFTREREAVAAAVEANGYDRRRASYVDAFDSQDLDAALVLLARYGYRDPSDPRMSSTFARLDAELGSADGFWYRYRRRRGSPFRSPEGVFQACGFWAVDYLALRGDYREAKRRFERLLEARNDLGLLSEEFDPGGATSLGNFPQAFSHLALVTAAFSLAAGKPQERGRPRAP